MRPVFSLLFTAALAGACASDRPPREATAFVVMEETPPSPIATPSGAPAS